MWGWRFDQIFYYSINLSRFSTQEHWESWFLICGRLNCSIITIRRYMCTIKCSILGVNVWRIGNVWYNFASRLVTSMSYDVNLLFRYSEMFTKRKFIGECWGSCVKCRGTHWNPVNLYLIFYVAIIDWWYCRLPMVNFETCSLMTDIYRTLFGNSQTYKTLHKYRLL